MFVRWFLVGRHWFWVTIIRDKSVSDFEPGDTNHLWRRFLSTSDLIIPFTYLTLSGVFRRSVVRILYVAVLACVCIHLGISAFVSTLSKTGIPYI